MYKSIVHLKNNIVPNDKDKDEEPNEIDENSLNFIFDESVEEEEERPVYYVHHIKQVFPIASICKLFMQEIPPHKGTYMLYLRADTRLEINESKYDNNTTGRLMYVSGKSLKNERLIDIGRSIDLT